MEKKELGKITREELNDVLEKHKRWLDTDGKEGERADLSYTDLRGFNLTRVNLAGADLSYTNLQSTNLWNSILDGVDMTGSNMVGSSLTNAYLATANLHKVNLEGADLRGAKLIYSNLRSADLMYADLQAADLHCSDLQGARMFITNLRYAVLHDTNLTDVKNFPDIPMVCPETGSFIGWKTVGDYIVKLEIPEDAKRSSGTSEQCRCNKAKVLAIENKDGTRADISEVRDKFGGNFTYIVRVGETVTVDDFDDNRFNIYSPGIKFFMDRDNQKIGNSPIYTQPIRENLWRFPKFCD